ncbi:unnamed protein product, partial [Heterotrigona itama]
AAIYWAEEGRCVVYITPAPLEELPAACHDRSNPAPTAFKLMRFINCFPILSIELWQLHPICDRLMKSQDIISCNILSTLIMAFQKYSEYFQEPLI